MRSKKKIIIGKTCRNVKNFLEITAVVKSNKKK